MDDLKFRTKTINWRDWLGQYHMNNVLMQNQNGPCFVISLVNTLILSSEISSEEWSTVGKKGSSTSMKTGNSIPPSMLVSLKKMLLSREVSLSSLLNELTHLMLTLNEIRGDTVDIGAILNVLPQLGTGLNVNLKLDNAVVADFEDQTASILQLLDLFDLKMVHGFLMTEPWAEYDTFDKIQDFLISVIDRHSDVALETMPASEILELEVDDAERELLRKYVLYRDFLAQNSTQLTEAGLETLKQDSELVPNNAFVIFFRNDHFNTLYKLENKLYLLANDEGYGSGIVWEELKTVKGSDDELLNGFFEVREDESDKPQENVEEAVYEDDPIAGADEQLAAQLQSQEDERLARNIQREYEAKRAKREKPKDKKPAKQDAKPDKCVLM
ncbi:hypothetical protein KL918_004655 [Ogataea parapolymorpha]|uniref:MINDY deubiquitinase domain-containing protein n=1 Tax=Ogataea parapolymorpha (strain ATCC 26012 / BCRC 20466 / JCM 22074 / NRRL Y-7560 / DL-1) TaxID=871575 RepID=W1QLA6_OGAPD|nr:hypothetical protein HPODL_00104 [Ogataea parapolymorpha DL-1]ESX03610.1 hypothetical protein HPODL_00104 [Ogataea parapolymorpha DL-1]KAG7865413.1 hypothetical protein KL918_004655 [Ogataea parapolymorpha]KAG7873858.1 hypothetical protein KL916_002018 [Ogataea parapolymorpha]